MAAAVIGDFISDPTRLDHAMIASPSSPSPSAAAAAVASLAPSNHQNHGASTGYHSHHHPHHHHALNHHQHQNHNYSHNPFRPVAPSASSTPRGLRGPFHRDRVGSSCSAASTCSIPSPTADASSAATTPRTAISPARHPQSLSTSTTCSGPDAAKTSAWPPVTPRAPATQTPEPQQQQQQQQQAQALARAEAQAQAEARAGPDSCSTYRPQQSLSQTSATLAAAPACSHGGASRFPSPPSSSPTVATDDANTVSMASQIKRDHVSSSLPGHPLAQAPLPQPSKQQPSPPSDDFNPSSSSSAVDPTQPPPHAVPPTNSSSSLPLAESVDDNASSTTQTVIHIRDLAHVQSLARADVRAGLGAGTLNDPPLQQMKYEISGMPIGDIIEMVAALLTKITTTNDLQHDAMQRNVTHQQQASQSGDASGSASHMSSLSHSVLAFHGKNVPAITILSYLSRIHRYCPTTYEVFLSLLVYFDRMTERVNERVTRNEEARRSNAQTNDAPGQSSSSAHKRTRSNPSQGDTRMRDQGESDESADETDSDLADDDDDDDDEMDDSPDESSRSGVKIVAPPPESPLASGPATYFVVDSFNIHRLIIAGVTCASKFFSDVFYTNSRYAKVGGLPLAELNHLELQFLILNDFRLAVPVEDLEAYATMLVEFYAREVVGRAPGSRD